MTPSPQTAARSPSSRGGPKPRVGVWAEGPVSVLAAAATAVAAVALFLVDPGAGEDGSFTRASVAESRPIDAARVASPEVAFAAPLLAPPGPPAGESPGKRSHGRNRTRPSRASAEAAFAEGRSLLRAANPEAAAHAFARAGALAAKTRTSRGLNEEAIFFHAVALTRAGRTAEADTVLDDFLDRFPHAARAREAAVMLGWSRFDRQDPSAATWFRAGLAAPSPHVRKSAEAGLAALARRESGHEAR
jgi:hypothetical protein